MTIINHHRPDVAPTVLLNGPLFSRRLRAHSLPHSLRSLLAILPFIGIALGGLYIDVPTAGAATAIGNVNVVPSSFAAGVGSSYAVTFTTSPSGSGPLTTGDTITLNGPSGFNFASAADEYAINGSPVSGATASEVNSSPTNNQVVLSVPSGVTIGLGGNASIEIGDVMNPVTSGLYSLQAWTSIDTNMVQSNSFNISATQSNVGCADAAGLHAAISAVAASDGTISLAADCDYTMTAADGSTSGNTSAAFPDISGDVTIIGNGSTITVGNGDTGFDFFQVEQGALLTLDDLTLSGAQSSGFGGAINNLGTLSLVGDIFSDNSGTNGGAISNDRLSTALYSANLHATTIVDQSSFLSNSASIDGGAIDNGDAGSGTLDVFASTFGNPQATTVPTEEGNSAAENGGAIDNADNVGSATSTISGSTFVGNSNTSLGTGGGAIANALNEGSGALNVASTTFTNNKSVEGFGGAIATADIGGSGTAVITGSTFSDNSAAQNGGAIDNGDATSSGIGGASGVASNGSLTVTASTFTAATGAARRGGAIDNGDDNGTGVATVTNSSFYGSGTGHEAYDGGAIDNGDGGNYGALNGKSTSSGILTVIASTFQKEESSNDGGAIDNADDAGTATLNVTDSTFGGSVSSDSNLAQGNGGAIDNGDNGGDQVSGSGTATITGSDFQNNVSDLDGGAIDNGDARAEQLEFGSSESDGTIRVTKSTFDANSAVDGDGGAIDNGDYGGEASATVSDSTFVANAANTGGSTIDNGNNQETPPVNTASAAIVASTFSANETTHGAIDNWSGSTQIGASILGDDPSSTGQSECAGTLPIADDGYNITNDATHSCGFTTATSKYDANLANELGSLGDNGGNTISPTISFTPNVPTDGILIPANPTTSIAGITVCPRLDENGTSDPVGLGQDCVPGAVGYGAVDPDAVTDIAVAPGNQQATVSWSEPNDGGSTITSYEVTATDESASNPNETCTASGESTASCVVPGLVNTDSYSYSVVATNAIGSSSPTTATPTASPTSGNATVTLSWTPAVNTPSGYEIYLGTRPGGESSTPVNGSLVAPNGANPVSYTDSGLLNGTTYYFKIAAVYGVGPSLSSNEVSATPESPTTHLQFTASPAADQSDTSGVAFSTQPTVTVENSLGVAVASPPSSITLSLVPPPGITASLTCVSNTATTNNNGVAVFSGCEVTGPYATYSIVATSNGLSSSTTTVTFSPPATFSSTYTTTFTQGTAGNFNVLAPASGSGPATSITCSNCATLLSSDDIGFSATSGTGTASITSDSGGVTPAGTYTLFLTASNTVGSIIQNFVLIVAPFGVPTNVSAAIVSPGTTATVSWTAPVLPIGTTVTNYTVTPINGTVDGTAVTTTATSYSFAGLTAADSYTFQVTANLSPTYEGAALASNAVLPVSSLPTTNTASSTSPSIPPVADEGTAGAAGSVAASASGGEGGVSVGTYSTANGFSSSFSVPMGSSSYDIQETPGSTFSGVSFEVCGDPSGQVNWYDPATGATVVLQGAPIITPVATGTDCVDVNLTATTDPSINDLGGTVFLVEPVVTSGSGGGGGGLTPQTIAWGNTPSMATVGTTMTLSVTASSGLAVTLTLQPDTTSGACVLSGTSLAFTGVGTCGLLAEQFGNSVYLATAVEKDVAVLNGQTLSFTSSAPAGATVGGSYSVSAKSTGSPTGISYSIDASSTKDACSISGSTVSFTGAGTCVVDANQGASGNFTAATQISQSFTIGALATIATTPPALTVTVTARTAVVKIETKKAVVKANKVPIAFSCSTLACTATVEIEGTITVKGKDGKSVKTDVDLGAMTVRLAKGKTATEWVMLDKTGQMIVADAKKHPVTLSMVVKIAGKTTKQALVVS